MEASEETMVSTTPSTPSVVVLACRMCRFTLCKEQDLLQDEINYGTGSGSFFLENPVDWMENVAGDTEGKLCCPKCSARIGRLSWVGYQALPDRWITPAIMLTRSKVDIMRMSSGLAADDQQQGQEQEEQHKSERGGGEEGRSEREEEEQPEGSVEVSPPAHESPAMPSTSQNVKASQDDDAFTELLEFEKQYTPVKKPSPSRVKSSKKASKYTDEELSTMDMLKLVELLDRGEVEMDRIIEAMDKAAAKKKAEERKKLDLDDPKVLMKVVMEEIGDREEFLRFREGCGDLRRNKISAEVCKLKIQNAGDGSYHVQDYFYKFPGSLIKLHDAELLELVLKALPEDEKRQEVLRLVREAVSEEF